MKLVKLLRKIPNFRCISLDKLIFYVKIIFNNILPFWIK